MDGPVAKYSKYISSLQATLNDKPLCNEPGINENHKYYNAYNNMICYKNIEIAILGCY